MHYPSTRLFSVLELLQTHTLLSGSDIAAKLEVDTRTVRRYILQLQEMGMPIETIKGRHGGYQLSRDYKLPPLVFHADEVLALAMGILFTKRMGLAQVFAGTESALAKFERIMPTRISEQLGVFETVLEMHTPEAYYQLDSDVLLELGQAAYHQQTSFIRYKGRNGQATKRKIDPYGLVFVIGLWYVAGYCHLRQGLRTFRIDRIESCQRLSLTFEQPADFDPQAFVEDAIAKTPGRWSVEILFKTDLETAKKQLPPTSAIFEEQTNGVLMRVQVNELKDIAYPLIKIEAPFQIIGPPELFETLHTLGERAIALSRQSVSLL